MVLNDTIVAPATPAGGALAVVRMSGPDALAVADRIFRGRAPLSESKGYRAHRGSIVDGDRPVDDVVALVFRAPNSYTGDESVEFSCHGSAYIVGEILRLCCAAGARMAEAGEFTARAFLAGKLDLAQAEAVADMIAGRSRTAHAVASMQLRGGVSDALNELRDKLLSLTSLLELELDFSEEDVTFADRAELRRTMVGLEARIAELLQSFRLGNALKEGVSVAIVGAPNVGKSTLLNRLAGEERALVSEIAGTTRDTVEEEINIDGVLFRFIDTAGMRATADRLEQMGIDRTRRAIARARIVLVLDDATRKPLPTVPTAPAVATFAAAAPPVTAPATATLATLVPAVGALADAVSVAAAPAATAPDTVVSVATTSTTAAPAAVVPDTVVFVAATPATTAPATAVSAAATATTPTTVASATDTPTAAATAVTAPDIFLSETVEPLALRDDQLLIRAVNKCDLQLPEGLPEDTILLSAKRGDGIDELRRRLRASVDTSALDRGDTIVSTHRHAEALRQADRALQAALSALDDGLTTDLLSEEIRQVIHHIGTITGTITTDEVLKSIFSKFCIGK